MSQMLELPDEVYEAVKRAADTSGTSVVDLLRRHFAAINGAAAGYGHTANAPTSPPRIRLKSEMTEEEKQVARERFRQLAGALDSGDPHSADNERIDADLARSYADNHEKAA